MKRAYAAIVSGMIAMALAGCESVPERVAPKNGEYDAIEFTRTIDFSDGMISRYTFTAGQKLINDRVAPKGQPKLYCGTYLHHNVYNLVDCVSIVGDTIIIRPGSMYAAKRDLPPGTVKFIKVSY
ncbi:hypothetical protein [Segnochrobactrum spirostomi]|uniref:Lipoprotein n=1 Tax=Segnochrobactrum spirostomi TaxID=2608987 RepID=A0A6A7Y0W8_9HYPH|nr:hypothetical protein [Segnochrobactrum spirostomi]MQT12027.1 hypothetical protein [Segnochrobactrum spirostomi]